MPDVIKVAQVVLEILVPTATATTLSILGAPPTGQVGNSYLFPFVASGGTPPYTFSISSGSLPAGVVLDPMTGSLSGMPTALGTFCFTVTVTDFVLATASLSVCITIYGAVVITFYGWKLYPEAPCEDTVPGVEIPKIDRAV